MAALQRAVALAEMDGVAVAVAEHLDFDVARLARDIFPDRPRRRRRRPWPRCARSTAPAREFGCRSRDLHAAAAAAGGRLDQHRKADLVGDLRRLVVGADAAVRAGHDGNAELLGGALGLDLVAHQADVLGLRADEMHVVLGEDFGEAGVLRQEAVAGMHRVGAGDLAGRRACAGMLR